MTSGTESSNDPREPGEPTGVNAAPSEAQVAPSAPLRPDDASGANAGGEDFGKEAGAGIAGETGKDAANTPSAGELDASWETALRAARRGDVSRARAICDRMDDEPVAFPGAAQYILGRCLAEAGDSPDEAIELLDQAIALDPGNIMTPYVRTLALLLAGRDTEAATALKRDGLPHDLSLLAHFVFEIESRMRPWSESLPVNWPSWPPQLGPDPGADLDIEAGAAEENDSPNDEIETPADEAETSKETEPSMVIEAPKLSMSQRRKLAKLIAHLEGLYVQFSHTELLSEVGKALDAGLDSADLQLLAGLAAEESGDGQRAKAHLSRALALEPDQLVARTYLGRAYGRSGQLEIADAMLRSLPVEGPYDYGRHYQLALVHSAAGRRSDAWEAMEIALRDFFVEAQEFYIERVLKLWLRSIEGGERS